MLVLGLGDGFKNPQIMEFGVLGLQNNESGFYYINLKRINSRKLLKVLFKHISPINGPKMAIIISIVIMQLFLSS